MPSKTLLKMNLVSLLFFLVAFPGHHIINAASLGEYTNSTSVDEDRDTPLTLEQENLVVEFRNENSAILTDGYLRSKSHIVGALRAKKWNKEDAGKQLRRMLQWRAANKIDELGESEPDKETLEWFPFRTDLYSRDGCPVTVAPFGDWHIDEYMLSKEFVRDAIHAFRKHTTQLFEKGRRATKNLVTHRPKCDQGILYIDVSNLTMANVAESNALNGMIHTATTLETYYANAYSHLIAINSNEDFRNMLKNLLPYITNTRRAARIYKEDETEQARKDVLSLIDPKELPPRFYGTKVE